MEIKSGGSHIKQKYYKNIYSAKKKSQIMSPPNGTSLDYPIDEEANSSNANKNSSLQVQDEYDN